MTKSSREETREQKKLAHLPLWMQHKEAESLIRLGRPHDGGYVVASEDIADCDILLSMGINDDWSFESDFLAISPVPLVAYDGSVGTLVFFRRLGASLFPLPRLGQAIGLVVTLWSYRTFFQETRRHVRKFVGSATGGEHLSVSDIFASTPSNRIFLKCDIEGAEYRILDGIIANRDRLSGLVVEFHDCDLHIDRIKNFARDLGLPIVHIHANNYAPCDSKTGLPLILEVTFSAHARQGDRPKQYPSDLDRPCNPNSPDFELVFSALSEESSLRTKRRPDRHAG